MKMQNEKMDQMLIKLTNQGDPIPFGEIAKEVQSVKSLLLSR